MRRELAPAAEGGINARRAVAATTPATNPGTDDVAARVVPVLETASSSRANVRVILGARQGWPDTGLLAANRAASFFPARAGWPARAVS